MWRLGEQLVGQCVHVDQQVPFLGSMVAKVTAIYIGGEKVNIFTYLEQGLQDVLIR